MAKKKEKEVEQEEVINEQEIETATEQQQQEEESGPTPEETIAKLQADIELAEKGRKEAEERANRLDKERGEAVSQSATAQQNAVQMHEQALESGLSAANNAIATIEQQLEEAYNLGDAKRIVELNKKLSTEAVRLSKLEDSKVSFDKWKEAQKNAPQQSDGGYSQTTRDWISRHPEFETNQEYKAEAIGAHSAAVARGYKPDTPAYFEFIDKRLESQFGGESAPAPKQQTKMPSAAPSRDNGTVSGKREGGRVATAKDIDAAETCGMSIGEYMKAKEQAEKEGLLK